MNYTNLNEAWNIENFTTEENESIVKMKEVKEVKDEQSESIVKIKEVKDDKSEIKLLSKNEQNIKLKSNIKELEKNIENLKKRLIDVQNKYNKILEDKNNEKSHSKKNDLLTLITNFIDNNRDTIIIILIILAVLIFLKPDSENIAKKMIRTKYIF